MKKIEIERRVDVLLHLDRLKTEEWEELQMWMA